MTHLAVDGTDLSGLTAQYSAHNYHPLPVVVASADGLLGDRRRTGGATWTCWPGTRR